MKDSTEELFAELDLAAQFEVACLDTASDGKVSYANMLLAVTVCASDSELDGDVIPKVIADLKKQPDVKYGTVSIDGKKLKGLGGRAAAQRGCLTGGVQGVCFFNLSG